MEMRRGTIRAFDSGTYRATLQMAGSLASWLRNVPVARNIGASEMVGGRSCAVILWDTANPADAVVVAVYS